MITVLWNVVPCSSVDGFLPCLSAVFVIFLFLYQVTSMEVDAKTKESTRKTEEKLFGRYKVGHERKKPK